MYNFLSRVSLKSTFGIRLSRLLFSAARKFHIIQTPSLLLLLLPDLLLSTYLQRNEQRATRTKIEYIFEFITNTFPPSIKLNYFFLIPLKNLMDTFSFHFTSFPHKTTLLFLSLNLLFSIILLELDKVISFVANK